MDNIKFTHLDTELRSMAYERGHSAGEEEVESIYRELRGDIYPALQKDLEAYDG